MTTLFAFLRITVYNVPRQISEDQTATFQGVRKGNGSCWFLFSHNIQKPGFLRLATKFEYTHFSPKLRDLNKAHLFGCFQRLLNFKSNSQK